MRHFGIVMLAAFLAMTISCAEYPQPTRPNRVTGWKDVRSEDVVNSLGYLVLKKGESSDNGRIGVTVVDIIPPPKIWGIFKTREGNAKVVLRLFRPSDQQKLCEASFSEGGIDITSPNYCGSSVPLSGISIFGINFKEGWVAFELFQPR